MCFHSPPLCFLSHPTSFAPLQHSLRCFSSVLERQPRTCPPCHILLKDGRSTDLTAPIHPISSPYPPRYCGTKRETCLEITKKLNDPTRSGVESAPLSTPLIRLEPTEGITYRLEQSFNRPAPSWLKWSRGRDTRQTGDTYSSDPTTITRTYGRTSRKA